MVGGSATKAATSLGASRGRRLVRNGMRASRCCTGGTEVRVRVGGGAWGGMRCNTRRLQK